jgi:hypothetical protein
LILKVLRDYIFQRFANSSESSFLNYLEGRFDDLVGRRRTTSGGSSF